MKDIKTFTISGNPELSLNDYKQCTIFFDDNNEYGYCLHGTDLNGNYYESDDVGGFKSEEEAEEAALKETK